MSSKTPVIAIVGRTNVGKSTLFNALARRRIAIVEDTPGVTRDRNYALIKQRGVPLSLVDTGGLVGEEEADFHTHVKRQTEIAISECDLVLAVFDGKSGVHALDEEVVDHLRRAGKKVIWVVNKCERPITEILSAEFFALGIDDLTYVSAAHRLGLDQLTDKILEVLELEPLDEEVTEEIKDPGDERLYVAILGKPNVGKSTLVNKLLGEDRLVTSEQAGTTRDSIDIEIVRDGKKIVLIDTAGLRKKSKVDDGTIERFGNLRTLKSLARADVAVLVLDATQGAPGEQDKKIASLIHERGTGFVIVVNKWDLVEKDHRTVKQFSDMLRREFNFATYAPIIFISALSGRRCPSVLEKSQEVAEQRKVRIKTADLNDVLGVAFKRKPPPVVRGEPVKLYFATQIQVAPPLIILFVNHPKELRPSYVRYLKTQLRKQFPFEGTDLKLELRKRTDAAERRSQKTA